MTQTSAAEAAAEPRSTIRLSVNGKDHVLDVPDRKLLSDVLRQDLELTGTHVGCEHGVCGACTVQLDGDPIRSCLILPPAHRVMRSRPLKESETIRRTRPTCSRPSSIPTGCNAASALRGSSPPSTPS